MLTALEKVYELVQSVYNFNTTDNNLGLMSCIALEFEMWGITLY